MNVCSALNAVKESLEEQTEEVQEEINDLEDEVGDAASAKQDQQLELETHSENVQGALDYLESVEFPGMYG